MIANRTDAIKWLAANGGRISFAPGDAHNMRIIIEVVLDGTPVECNSPLPIKWIDSNLSGAVFVCVADLLRTAGARAQGIPEMAEA